MQAIRVVGEVVRGVRPFRVNEMIRFMSAGGYLHVADLVKQKRSRTRILMCALVVAFALASNRPTRVRAQSQNSGKLVLDKDGSARFPFSRGYLDDHYCVVGDGWDEITVGFSARGFNVSEGQPDQEIYWACAPLK